MVVGRKREVQSGLETVQLSGHAVVVGAGHVTETGLVRHPATCGLFDHGERPQLRVAVTTVPPGQRGSNLGGQPAAPQVRAKRVPQPTVVRAKAGAAYERIITVSDAPLCPSAVTLLNDVGREQRLDLLTGLWPAALDPAHHHRVRM